MLAASVFTVLLVFSCKKENKEIVEEKNESVIEETNQKELPKIIPLLGKAKEVTDKWAEFIDFDSELRRLYEKDIDLVTLLTELERREVDLEVSKFPEKLDNPAVKSRLLVLRTYLGRAKAAVLENDPVLMRKEKEDIIKAYNALRVQMEEVFKKNIAEEFLEKDSI